MTDLNAIINSANSAYAQQSAGTSGSDLNQSDFLRLMATQLRSQDPSQPMDPSSFFNQLTQFSMVSGLQGLQSSFNSLAASLTSQSSIQPGDLLGHKVKFASDKNVLGTDGMHGAVGVPANATSVTVEIKDASGHVVRTIAMDTSKPGTQDFTWDGQGDGREPLPPGVYTMSATATVAGVTAPTTTYAVADVASITLGANGQPPMIDVGALGQISLSQVLQVI
jgi:flagellar basal-body rod modification protein FlgD